MHFTSIKVVNILISARKIHSVLLTESEIQQLKILLHKGSENTRVITRARVLLLANNGKIDRDIYGTLGLAVSTPYDIRKRYHAGGLKNALYDLPRPGQKRKLTGKQEAEVIAIACTKAPKGYTRWTLDLLTEKVKSTLGISIGRTAIWNVCLRNKEKPWLKKNVVYSKSNGGI